MKRLIHNPDCCGDHCHSEKGLVKVYPLGCGANLILCKDCWDWENAYRRQRGAKQQNSDAWPVLDWETAKVYQAELRPYGKFAHVSMPHGCLYLNNNGSRWVHQDMRFVLVLPDGTRRVRLAVCYESFGNFAVIVYKYRGKTYRALPKNADGFETPIEGAEGLRAIQHVFHK